MRIVYVFAIFVTLTVHVAFEFVALLYKPAILWIAVPILTAGLYVYAANRRSIAHLDVWLVSLAIAALLSFDLVRGFVASLAPGSRPLYATLMYGGLYFLISNVLCLLGAWLVIRIRSPAPPR